LRLCAVRTRVPVVTTPHLPGAPAPDTGWLVIGKGRDPESAIVHLALRARAGHATAVVAAQVVRVADGWQALGTAVVS
jgi:hypothetical protein